MVRVNFKVSRIRVLVRVWIRVWKGKGFGPQVELGLGYRIWIL